ncbi:hypothetical protein OsI_32186 [Oryza sativa Indica Group]|uniref:Uncharacterized protein n=1 Tax=Oryza sativa subsp. indica TaxID=39946 RepID=B8BDX2_ORYSI|nr:hypothetical protein OsI_32186 [Oryza sativa Indica Group]
MVVADNGKWALEKARALQDLEEEFNQQIARILSCYQLPDHIRLDLHEQHRNDYKVPDDLRLKFVNAVFEGKSGMLDQDEELRVQARKESEKFWVEAAGAAKKAQALQDMEERNSQLFFKHYPGVQDMPDHIREYCFRKFMEDARDEVEVRFGIRNHEMRLRIRAWEESQQFLIKTMADGRAAKKVQALQDEEKRYVQGVKKTFDSENISEYFQQAFLQQGLLDNIRLLFIDDIEEKFNMPDDEEEPKGYISEDYNRLKAQALQDLEYKFNQQTARILKRYDLPEHIRLDLQEQHYNNYKVPDNLRIKFINAVFNGNPRILDHKRELKVQARKEAEKFWIEAAATAKKAQALQDLEERYKQQFIKPSYDREDISEHMQEYFLRERKITDKAYLEYKNNQFRIKMMADERAAKKVKALQDMEERYVQDYINKVERLDVPDYIKQGVIQECKVPDGTRLRYINYIEEKFRMLDDQEERKVHIWENFKKLKIPLTIKSPITVAIMFSIGIMILFSGFLVPKMPKSLKIMCWATSIVICFAAVLSYDNESSKTTAPTEMHGLENPPSI